MLHDDEKPGLAYGFGKIIGWMIMGLLFWAILIFIVWLTSRTIGWWAKALS